jgi:hypothetical protein
MKAESPRLRATLWTLAIVITVVAVLYQRATGPTYPKRGAIQVENEEWGYRLVRSDYSDVDARVVLPSPPNGVQATLNWRRYPTNEDFTAVLLAYNAEEYVKGGPSGGMVAVLPKQPAAGKLEYYLDVKIGDREFRIPEITAETPDGEQNIVIRYKDRVPGMVLWPHVVMMFLSLLVGMRAAFSALAAPSQMRKLAWFTLACLTIGGMVLGPFVQKYAFGHYWTGFPNGTDLTDNKMLIQWIAWILACGAIGFKPKPKEGVGRGAVVLAAIVMTGVYMIPHSMRGSELDYSKLDQGVDPTAAIGTGEK